MTDLTADPDDGFPPFPPPTADLDRLCDHPDAYVACKFERITEVDDGPVTGYYLNARVRCVACGEPFRFTGVPAGLSPAQPMCSIDDTTIAMPIRPQSADPDFGLGGIGYSVRMV